MQEKISNAIGVIILGGLLALLSGAIGDPFSQTVTLLQILGG